MTNAQAGHESCFFAGIMAACNALGRLCVSMAYTKKQIGRVFKFNITYDPY